MKTPDITPAQIGALLVALGGQAVAFGILSAPTEQLTVAAVTAALGLGWKIADAIIRHGRANATLQLQQIADLLAPRS